MKMTLKSVSSKRHGALKFMSLVMAATFLIGVPSQSQAQNPTWFDSHSFWRTKTTDAGTKAAGDDADKLWRQFYYMDDNVTPKPPSANYRACVALEHKVWVASPTQTLITVAGDTYNHEWGANVPWVPGAELGLSVDKHVTIYQPSTHKMWEFWSVSGTYPNISAGNGGYFVNVENSPGILPSFNAVATGLALEGGTITKEDAARIEAASITDTTNLIPHVLCINIPQVDSSGHWAPATSNDGQGGPNMIKEGRRFRLPPDVALPTESKLLRAIVIAARDYGIVVRDCTGRGQLIDFLAEQPKTGDTIQSADWTAIMAPKATWNVVDSFPWTQLRVLTPIQGWGFVNGSNYEIETVGLMGTCLKANQATVSGYPCNVWPYYGSPYELWTAQSQSDGSFELIPTGAPLLRLAVPGTGTSGSQVITATDTSGPEQHWSASLNWDGSSTLYPKNTTTSCALNATGTAQGSNVNIYPYWGQTSLRWTLVGR